MKILFILIIKNRIIWLSIVKKGVKMLSVNIEKTPFYRIGREEGIEEGIFKSAMVMINKFKISIDETAKGYRGSSHKYKVIIK